MYQGPTENVPSYFGDRGHPNPPHYNPADWCMNVAQSISKEKLEQDGFFPKDNRDIGDAFEGEQDGKDALGITVTKHDSVLDADEKQVGMATQTYMLFSREFKNLTRDTMALGARIGLTTFLSLLVGIIFLDVGEADPTDQNVSAATEDAHQLTCSVSNVLPPLAFFSWNRIYKVNSVLWSWS